MFVRNLRFKNIKEVSCKNMVGTIIFILYILSSCRLTTIKKIIVQERNCWSTLGYLKTDRIVSFRVGNTRNDKVV